MAMWTVLVLCLLGVTGAIAAPQRTRARNYRSTFLNVVNGGYGVNLPVLVLPVPVFVKPDTCEVHNSRKPVENENTPNLPFVVHPQYTEVPRFPNPTIQHVTISDYSPPSKTLSQHELGNEAPPPHSPAPQPVQSSQSFDSDNSRSNPEAVHQPHPSYDRAVDNELEAAREVETPHSRGRDQLFANSDDLIRSYRQQRQKQPGSPAAVPVGRRLPARISPPLDPPLEDVVYAPAPPRPNFNRSLHLRIDLSVPRAGFTEAYDIEWHAVSDTARTIVEDGSTTIYRVPLLDGRVQFLEIAVDETEGDPVRRCTMSPIMTPSSADKLYPGLPNMDDFFFVGYTTAEGGVQVEHWHNNVIGKPGEGGAAPGESLNFTHRFLVYRDGEDAVPLKYTVGQSSSILGPAIDGYDHRYELLPAPSTPILPDVAKECDVIVHTEDKNRREKRWLTEIGQNLKSIFDPLSSFLKPTLDHIYNPGFEDFKNKYKRSYRDNKEQAVRQAQYINTQRHVSAVNRVATRFKTAINFFADLVMEEIEWYFGVGPEPEETPPGLTPPEFSFSELQKLYEKLPKDYDEYREKGGVSAVQNQGTCMACWAFSVAGSTEGALFKKTRKLVPLSPQSLVDCGKEYKTNGCKESWPMYGYSQIKDQGIPALKEYPYDAQVHECKAVPPVTRISGYRNVSASIEGVKVAIFRNAPTVVLVGASIRSFLEYNGQGVYDDQLCNGHEHAVLGVGWGSKGGDHLILKNSWSSKWGDQGYIRLDPAVCSVTDKPSYAIVKKDDILRDDLRSAYQEK